MFFSVEGRRASKICAFWQSGRGEKSKERTPTNTVVSVHLNSLEGTKCYFSKSRGDKLPVFV